MKHLEFHIDDVKKNIDKEMILELPDDAVVHSATMCRDVHNTIEWVRVIWSEEVEV